MTTPDRDPAAAASPTWDRVDDPAAIQTLEVNWLFRLRRERFRSRLSGKTHDYYLIHLADAVQVIALTPDRQVVLVRQFRAGSNHDSLEPPGGLLEPGEDPLAAGVRELAEETGYVGDPPRLLGTVWSNPSILTSRFTTILVTNARPAAATHLDASEELNLELVPAASIPAMIRDGRIDHALAVNGLLWWLASEQPGPLALAPPRRRYPLRLADGIALVAILAVWLAVGMRIDRFTLARLGVGFFYVAPVLVFLAWRAAADAWRGRRPPIG